MKYRSLKTSQNEYSINYGQSNIDTFNIPSTTLIKKNSFKQSIIAPLTFISFPFILEAAVFEVNQPTDDGTGLIPNTLSWTILQANTQSGTDIINLNTDVTITGVMKRLIDSDLILKSNGVRRTIDGNDQFRPLFIKSGQVTITNLDINNSRAQGGVSIGNHGGTSSFSKGAGMGGAIFIYGGTINLFNMGINESTAQIGPHGSTRKGYDPGFPGGAGGGMYGNGVGTRAGRLFSNGSNDSYEGYGNYQDNNAGFDQASGFGGGGHYNGWHGSDGGFGGGGAYGYTYYDYYSASGGNGGFGGGGGRAECAYYYTSCVQGVSGYRGPAAMGGGIFVRSGNLNMSNVVMNNNSANAGTGTEGSGGLGGAIFILHTPNNPNGNNQGMPSQLPIVNACNMSFSGNTATASTVSGVNTNIFFDVAGILNANTGINPIEPCNLIFKSSFEL